jgi:hypothetical protein
VMFAYLVLIDAASQKLTYLLCLDFPAVDDSFLFGSLGAMVVRKDNDGIELFFAHNTQSFVRHNSSYFV